MSLEPVCSDHSGVPAAATCARCGKFLCLQCAVERVPRPLCAPCASKVVAERASAKQIFAAAVGAGTMAAPGMCKAIVVSIQFPPNAQSLFWSGLISAALAFPIAIAVIVVGASELRRVGRGESPRRGRTEATAAVVFGLFGVCAAIGSFVSAMSKW